jgi:NADP-dependent 3-hydroxy acid dehydrogenase YdfG
VIVTAEAAASAAASPLSSRVRAPTSSASTTLQDKARRQGLSSKVLPLVADITRRADVDAAIAQVHAAFGQVDALVNNARGATPGPFVTLTQTDRDWQIALKIDGVINSTQAVAGDMLSRAKGSIIDISANTTQLVADNIVHYRSVKGFLTSFRNALAYERGQGRAREQHLLRLDRAS